MKLYVSEAASEGVNRALEGRDDLLASDLVTTEIASALARRVREERLRPEHARRVHQTILSALHAGPYRRLELGREEHREAERLLLGRPDLALRAADALHLALARSGRAVAMATFDRRLAQAARATGMSTYPRGGP
ncbi:MAG: PIN domain-containing protein [Candidatus Rokubacteria bacterium]|nr:PIN domain-containing protein [Candidatus Rokubacteria bacterium]